MLAAVATLYKTCLIMFLLKSMINYGSNRSTHKDESSLYITVLMWHLNEHVHKEEFLFFVDLKLYNVAFS